MIAESGFVARLFGAIDKWAIKIGVSSATRSAPRTGNQLLAGGNYDDARLARGTGEILGPAEATMKRIKKAKRRGPKRGPVFATVVVASR